MYLNGLLYLLIHLATIFSYNLFFLQNAMFTSAIFTENRPGKGGSIKKKMVFQTKKIMFSVYYVE